MADTNESTFKTVRCVGPGEGCPVHGRGCDGTHRGCEIVAGEFVDIDYCPDDMIGCTVEHYSWRPASG